MTSQQPISLDDVLEAERAEIAERRARRGHQNMADSSNTLFGICFSGGGIRSATFHLGVLQGLASRRLLGMADYLSTVSGGGYIGGWLHGLIKREPFRALHDESGKAFSSYQDYLAGESKKPGNSDVDPITFLRKFSNYLAPQPGLLSGDAWVIFAIWLRNTLLNQLILYLGAAGVLLVPLILGNLANFAKVQIDRDTRLPYAIGFCVVALLAVAVFRMTRNLRQIQAGESGVSESGVNDDNASFWPYIGVIFASAVLLSELVYAQTFDLMALKPALCISLGLLFLFGALLYTGGFLQGFKRRHRAVGYPTAIAYGAIFLACTAAATYAALLGVTSLLKSFLDFDRWYVLALGPPLFTAALGFGVVILIGLMGADFPDSSREWLSRVGVNVSFLNVAWFAAFALVVFVPEFILDKIRHNWIRTEVSVLSGWALTTAAGVLSGKSAGTAGVSQNAPAKRTSPILEILANYAPPIALFGVIVFVTTSSYAALQLTPFHNLRCLDPAGVELLLVLFIVLVSTGVFLSFRVNINEFSMNHFYKNRLVRCYLGASQGKRRSPNRLTGFDPLDDLNFAELTAGHDYYGPYPIVNCALNLNHGSELAWQERKASSFVFTPLYSGYRPAHSLSGFAHTAGFTSPDGPSLGMVTSISGAAANPNWGYHTNPVTAFLMTVFNVRLGWWLGNTGRRDNSQAASRPGPGVAIKYLLSELFGFTNETSRYINLSDGGHFENLGLYELVRRKCRFLIVGDGEQDEAYQFESLGGAIRKCRIDFGAEIEISPKRIFLDNDLSQVHCALGKITYNDGSKGTILYLKASLTGDEDYDVEQYKKAHSAFPHDSTMNQFFTESQFESYRSLGRHVVEKVLAKTQIPQGPEELPKLFDRLSDLWVAPTSASSGVFSRQADTLSSLVNRLSAEESLRFLDAEVFPGMKAAPRPAADSPELRRARFLCVDFIQLMEDVYLDLHFGDDGQFDHPENRGWAKLFRHWAKGPTFQETWLTVRSTYGTLFGEFFDSL